MEFSTKECAWSQVTVRVLGRKIIGLRGFEFKKSVEKEHVYASGSKPVDILSGNEKCEGNLKMLKYELDFINDAAQAVGFTDILSIPHELVLVTVQYKRIATDPIRTMVANGVAFTEMPVTMEQNAKMSEVTLPFLAMDIVHAKI